METRRKRGVKSALAVVLALITLFTCAPLAFAAGDGAPVINVVGRQPIYDGISTDSPRELKYGSKETLKNVVMQAAPYAADAMLLGTWTKYSNKTYNLLMKAYEGFPLNEDGEVENDTGIIKPWQKQEIEEDYTNSVLYTYYFEYDARLSPLDIADDLNDYIEAVKAVTGCKKVSIVGRCLGANVMLAYLYKYQEAVKFRGIKSIVFYDHSVWGVDVLDAAMSGTISFEEEALKNFLNNYDPDVNSEALAAMLALALPLMQTSYGISASASTATNFYEHTKYSLFQRFLKSTYATCPGFWSMVYDHYDEAKEYIFSDPKDAYTYARLIKKIDSYRNNVQLRVADIIMSMQSAGVHVANICKYGFQSYPLYDDAFRLSDNTTSLPRQSFGATCSTVKSTLSSGYIESRKASGYGDYISPDKQVDASTCMLPDTTWFIKNCIHTDFHSCIEPLIFNICRRQINVFSNTNYPQYMVMQGSGSKKKIVPMTASNCDPRGDLGGGAGSGSQSFLSRIVAFFRNLAGVFSKIIALLGGN